jgi:hypothetical protein
LKEVSEEKCPSPKKAPRRLEKIEEKSFKE